MDEAEFKAAYKRLDEMGRRVDAVIAKEKRGPRMPVLNFKPRVMKAKPQPLPEPAEADLGYATEIEIAPMTAQHYYLPDEEQEPDMDFFAGFRAEYDKMAKRQRRGARMTKHG